jgi:hypothetical protein
MVNGWKNKIITKVSKFSRSVLKNPLHCGVKPMVPGLQLLPQNATPFSELSRRIHIPKLFSARG